MRFPQLEVSLERDEDEECWSKWQLWEFMQVFGGMFGLGREMPCTGVR